jgi:hypothetical protein
LGISSLFGFAFASGERESSSGQSQEQNLFHGSGCGEKNEVSFLFSGSTTR